jgi:hypothetical protein
MEDYVCCVQKPVTDCAILSRTERPELAECRYPRAAASEEPTHGLESKLSDDHRSRFAPSAPAAKSVVLLVRVFRIDRVTALYTSAQTGTRLAPAQNKRGLTTPSNPLISLSWALSDSNTRPTD